MGKKDPMKSKAFGTIWGSNTWLKNSLSLPYCSSWGGFDLLMTLELFNTWQVEEDLNTFSHPSHQKDLISFSVRMTAAKPDVHS